MFRQNTIVQLKAREDTKYDADVTVTVQQIIDSYGCSPVSNIASLLYWFIQFGTEVTTNPGAGFH